jgi:hypothetical protein
MYPQSSKAISAILIAVDADIQTLKARSVKKLVLSSDSAQQALPKKPITVNVERRRNFPEARQLLCAIRHAVELRERHILQE